MLKGILTCIRRLLAGSIVVLVALAFHLFAVGLLCGRQRPTALAWGVLILCFLAFRKTTRATCYYVVKFYVHLMLVANTVFVIGGAGLGAVGLIVSAVADDRRGMQEAGEVVRSCCCWGFLAYFALAIVGQLFGFWGDSGVPQRWERNLPTASEVQGAIRDRLASQWEEGR